MSNGYYVAWGVWDAEHRALSDRVRTIEDAAARGRSRAWAIGLMLATALICPLLVTALITFLHLSAAH